MTFGKRQLVIAALVAALGTAVYLNWQFSGTVPTDTVSAQDSSHKQLGQTTYVNTELSSGSSEAKNKDESSTPEKTVKEAAASEVTENEPFEEERKKRSESEAKAVEALQDILEAASSSDAAKKEAVAAAKELADIIKVQSDIEAEIRAKGFDDAFVAVNNGSCSVTVAGGKLDSSSAIIIKDIVNRQSGTPFEQITISSLTKDESSAPT